MLLRRVELAGQYQRSARAQQLGRQQVEVAALEHLVVVGGMTPGELGHRLGLTSGGVTALAGRLIAAGHVTRSGHPGDKRMRILTATEEGEAKLGQEMEPVLEPTERALSWLDEMDTDRLVRLFEALVPLREHGAAATPGPEAVGSGDDYRPALLM